MRTLPLIIGIGLLVSVPSICSAESRDRTKAIEKELECVSRGLDQKISWEDVCATDSSNASIETMDEFDQTNAPPSAAQSDLKPADRKSQRDYDDSDYARAARIHHDLFSDSEGPAYRSTAFREKEHSLEVGPEISMFEYEEPGVMREKGMFYGGYLTYAFRPQLNDTIYSKFLNVYKADVRVLGGEVDYDSYGTGTLDDIGDFMAEARATLGSDVYFKETIRLTPYAGFGFRYLNDDSGGMQTSSGHFGYERESHYMYVPVGFEFAVKLDTWTVAIIPEYDIFLSGKQKSHLSDVSALYGDLENDQEDGYGLRGAVRITKDFDRFSFAVEPFIRYWHIDDSEVSTSSGTLALSGIEPENKSTEIGVRVGAEF